MEQSTSSKHSPRGPQLVLSPSRSNSIHGISSPSSTSSQQSQQQQQQQQGQQLPLSPMSQHQAKKEAHHNRRAIHRRTQSQFDFKNYGGAAAAAPAVVGVTGNTSTTPTAALTPSLKASGGMLQSPLQQQQQQHLPSQFMLLQPQHSPSSSASATFEMGALNNNYQAALLSNQSFPNNPNNNNNFMYNSSPYQVGVQSSGYNNISDTNSLLSTSPSGRFDKFANTQQLQQQQPQQFITQNAFSPNYYGQSQPYQLNAYDGGNQQTSYLTGSSQSSSAAATSVGGMTTIQMIQLMQVRQSQEKQLSQKEQIIESIDDDVLKQASSNAYGAANNGFNFGKKKSKLYSMSSQESILEMQTATSALVGAASAPSPSGSMPSSTMFSNASAAAAAAAVNSSGRASYGKGEISPGKMMGFSGSGSSFFPDGMVSMVEGQKEQSTQFSYGQSQVSMPSHHNHLLSSVLQPIPEQEVSSLGEFSTLSQPGSTRNNNNNNNNQMIVSLQPHSLQQSQQVSSETEKKSTFHSHSSSMSNPVTLSPQVLSPTRTSSHMPIKRRVSSSKFSSSSREDENLSNTLGAFNTNGGGEDREVRISSAREHYKSTSGHIHASIQQQLQTTGLTVESQDSQQISQSVSINSTTSPKLQQISSPSLPQSLQASTSGQIQPLQPASTTTTTTSSSSAVSAGVSFTESKFFSSIKKQQQQQQQQQQLQQSQQQQQQQPNIQEKQTIGSQSISTPSAIIIPNGSQQNPSSDLPSKITPASSQLTQSNTSNGQSSVVSTTSTKHHKKQSSLAEEMDFNLKTIQAHLHQLSKLDKPSQQQGAIQQSSQSYSGSLQTPQQQQQSQLSQQALLSAKSQSNPKILTNNSGQAQSASYLAQHLSPTSAAAVTTATTTQTQQQQITSSNYHQPHLHSQQILLHQQAGGASTSHAKSLSKSIAITQSQELVPASLGLTASNSDRNPTTTPFISMQQQQQQQYSKQLSQSQQSSTQSSNSLLDSKRHRPLQESKAKPRTNNAPQMLTQSSNSTNTKQSGVGLSKTATARTFAQVASAIAAPKMISGSSSNPTLHQRKSSATAIAGSNLATNTSSSAANSNTTAANNGNSNNNNNNNNANISNSGNVVSSPIFSQSAIGFTFTKTSTQQQQQSGSFIESQQQPLQQQQQQQMNSSNAANSMKSAPVLKSGKQQQQHQSHQHATSIAVSSSIVSSNVLLQSQQSNTGGESKKITELESIVSELRSRMHHLEETNSFLLNNIRSLLDEKQSDKKHIKDIECQTQQNNINIAAIRQIITSKSSGNVSAKGIDSSTHIFTDASSSNESQGPDTHYVLNQTASQTSQKDNNTILAGSFLQNSPVNNNVIDTSFQMKQQQQQQQQQLQSHSSGQASQLSSAASIEKIGDGTGSLMSSFNSPQPNSGISGGIVGSSGARYFFDSGAASNIPSSASPRNTNMNSSHNASVLAASAGHSQSQQQFYSQQQGYSQHLKSNKVMNAATQQIFQNFKGVDSIVSGATVVANTSPYLPTTITSVGVAQNSGNRHIEGSQFSQQQQQQQQNLLSKSKSQPSQVQSMNSSSARLQRRE